MTNPNFELARMIADEQEREAKRHIRRQSWRFRLMEWVSYHLGGDTEIAVAGLIIAGLLAWIVWGYIQ